MNKRIRRTITITISESWTIVWENEWGDPLVGEQVAVPSKTDLPNPMALSTKEQPDATQPDTTQTHELPPQICTDATGAAPSTPDRLPTRSPRKRSSKRAPGRNS